MASQPHEKEFWTSEEYLELDNESEIRYEYIDGEIYAMSGGTASHAKIVFNLPLLLGPQIRKHGCQGFSNDMRVQVSGTKYVYPDLSITCNEPEYTTDREITLINPMMVVEVVSESSKFYEHVTKREMYQTMPSVQIYLIVEQNRPHVTLYTRQADGWLVKIYSGLDAIVTLDAIHCELKLSKLYETVEFEPYDPDAASSAFAFPIDPE